MRNTKMACAALFGAVLLTSTSAVRAEDTTITFLSAEREETFKPVIASFEKIRPDIKVIHQSVPFNDLNAAIESRIGHGDTSIDVIAADTPRIPAYGSKGYLMNLDDRSAAIKAAVPNPIDIEQVSYDGKLYAYPMWTSTQLLFYNRGLLKAAGIEAPSPDVNKRLTWDVLLEQAKSAQKAGAKWGVVLEQVDRYYQLQMLFESAGAGSGLKGNDLLQSAISSEPWKKTAQWYGDIFSQGLSPRGVTPEQTDDLFINGELAFMIGGPWGFARYEGVKGLDYGVAPVPYFKDGRPVTPTGSWAIALNPRTKHLEAARAFAEYATLNAEGAYFTVSANPLPPTNAEAFKAYAKTIAALTSKIGPAIDIIGYEAQHTAVGRPRTRGYVTFETVMNKAFSDIRNGASAAETLEASDRQLARQLSRLP